MVQANRSKMKLSSPFGQVIMECRQMLQELNIALFFIRRSDNMAVYAIARESCSFSGQVFDGNSFPVNL